MDETEKRRELQLMLLREGYTQDEARKAAASEPAELLDKWLVFRKDAMRFPERQIVPIGTLDLADVKSRREEALLEAEEAKYFKNRARLAALMPQSFSLQEITAVVLQALLDVVQANGVDRLAAMTDITKTVDGLRRITEFERAAGGEAKHV
jgi:hypothetical protein